MRKFNPAIYPKQKWLSGFTERNALYYLLHYHTIILALPQKVPLAATVLHPILNYVLSLMFRYSPPLHMSFPVHNHHPPPTFFTYDDIKFQINDKRTGRPILLAWRIVTFMLNVCNTKLRVHRILELILHPSILHFAMCTILNVSQKSYPVCNIYGELPLERFRHPRTNTCGCPQLLFSFLVFPGLSSHLRELAWEQQQMIMTSTF